MTQNTLFSRVRLTAFVLVGAVSLFSVGCASSSTAERDAADERVSGQPPSADEDVRRGLPRGPDVLTGSTGAAAQPSASGQAEVSADASVTRAELKQFILKGPSFPLSMVEVEPAREGSKFVGYRVIAISPVAQPTLQGRLGKGDIITHLNGVRVEKPDDYLNAWKLLAGITTVRIDFVRDGQASYSAWQVQ
ncbi:hypothetical protein [Bradymonas sediminis]|uniref:Uncharacterized protein n=1 Tax=Bradymonas sediminis TaxID=1548548 RepID=A0A2Z4FKQ2_9DELT|nr:hypothetical protein [Bradymonas sediminis]AWV89410.1 hypothetical protein DN745_08695 [Bradymonas sediminis]TDP73592.1 hypothetical protein DFR33_106236 [Bradymonas sediminis]